jgi:hypothetical protein
VTRRALVIAYFFPPLAGVGVQRSLKFVTYLPDSGWEPVVIAPRDPAYWLVDPGSLARLPAGLEVHRSFLYEPARLHRTLSRLAGRGRRTTAQRLTATGDGSPRGAARTFARWAWLAAVRTLTFPDEQMTWIPWAVRSTVRAHRSRPAHAIYSSASPVTAHLVAGLAKRRTGLPWIADFRDPWIGNSFLRAIPAAPAPRRALDRRVGRPGRLHYAVAPGPVRRPLPAGRRPLRDDPQRLRPRRPERCARGRRPLRRRAIPPDLHRRHLRRP